MGQLQEPHLFAVRSIEGWPVYASAGRPRSAIVASWREVVLRQMAIGVPATGALMVLTFLLRRSQRAAAAQAGRLQALFDTDAFGLAETDGSGRFIDVNSRFCAMVRWSRQELLGGMTRGDLILPQDPGRSRADAPATVADRVADAPPETLYLRRDGTTFWAASHCAPDYDAAGRLSRMVIAIQDISDRKAAETRHGLMVRELDHRAKNLLAVVQSVIRLTPKTDAEAYAKRVEGRIAALARVHNLLASDRWEGASFHRVAAAELAAFEATDGIPGTPRIVMDGPELQLQPAAAQGLAMVFHELATNAAKHGALSLPGGQVRLSWRLDTPAGLLRMEWRERGGPPVTSTPTRLGFGTRMIQSTLRSQLGGTVDERWEPEGLTCSITIPADRAVTESGFT